MHSIDAVTKGRLTMRGLGLPSTRDLQRGTRLSCAPGPGHVSHSSISVTVLISGGAPLHTLPAASSRSQQSLLAQLRFYSFVSVLYHSDIPFSSRIPLSTNNFRFSSLSKHQRHNGRPTASPEGTHRQRRGPGVDRPRQRRPRAARRSPQLQICRRCAALVFEPVWVLQSH